MSGGCLNNKTNNKKKGHEGGTHIKLVGIIDAANNQYRQNNQLVDNLEVLQAGVKLAVCTDGGVSKGFGGVNGDKREQYKNNEDGQKQ